MSTIKTLQNIKLKYKNFKMQSRNSQEGISLAINSQLQDGFRIAMYISM